MWWNANVTAITRQGPSRHERGGSARRSRGPSGQERRLDVSSRPMSGGQLSLDRGRRHRFCGRTGECPRTGFRGHRRHRNARRSRTDAPQARDQRAKNSEGPCAGGSAVARKSISGHVLGGRKSTSHVSPHPSRAGKDASCGAASPHVGAASGTPGRGGDPIELWSPRFGRHFPRVSSGHRNAIPAAAAIAKSASDTGRSSGPWTRPPRGAFSESNSGSRRRSTAKRQ